MWEVSTSFESSSLFFLAVFLEPIDKLRLLPLDKTVLWPRISVYLLSKPHQKFQRNSLHIIFSLFIPRPTSVGLVAPGLHRNYSVSHHLWITKVIWVLEAVVRSLLLEIFSPEASRHGYLLTCLILCWLLFLSIPQGFLRVRPQPHSGHSIPLFYFLFFYV